MIKIMADSTCDLSEEILRKYNISTAPLTVTIEGKEYRDKIDLTPDEFFDMLKSLDESPSTSMPSPAEYLEIINEAIEAGHTEILCICMSSGTSGAYQSAVLAKEYFYEQFPDSPIKLHIVDSKSMSHGSGYLIMKLAMLREKGFDYEELVAFAEIYKANVKHFLSVDDLDNLIRSGRLNNSSAFLGKILKIKPIMSMKKGKGSIIAKERGGKRVLAHFIKEFKIRNDEDITDFIIVGYTSNRAIAEILRQKILEETDFKGEIYIMQMGSVVGTHVGLGGVSMYFVEKGHRRDGLLVNELSALIDKKNELIAKIKSKYL